MFHPTSEFGVVGAVREEEEPIGEGISCSCSYIQLKASSFHSNTQGRAATQGLVFNATAAGCKTAPLQQCQDILRGWHMQGLSFNQAVTTHSRKHPCWLQHSRCQIHPAYTQTLTFLPDPSSFLPEALTFVFWQLNSPHTSCCPTKEVLR